MVIIIIIIINFSEKGSTKGLYKVVPNTQHKYSYMYTQTNAKQTT